MARCPFTFSIVLAGVCLAQSPGSMTVTSAASFQQGLVPKGSIATAFCTGLQVQGVIYSTGNPLPLTLAGISIAVGGAPAPILGVADDGGYQQVNFEIPQEATPNSDGTWTVTASQNGTQLSAQAAALQSPGEFFLVAANVAAFQHAADFSLVTAQNPAHAGEILVGYLTGLPGSQPVVPTGQAAPFSPLAVVPQPNTVTLVDQFALLLNGTVIANGCSTPNMPCDASNILFLGLTPGIVGVYAVVFRLPSSTGAGDLGIQLQRSTCATISGTPCGGMGVPFIANAAVGCMSLGGGGTRTVCTSRTVPLLVQ